MPKSEFLPLDAHLCYAIYSANIAINRTYRPVLDELGISYPQYLVMNVLWEQDGQTIGAIAERLALESSTITPLVKRLEVAGLIARERNPQDERQVIVTLSAEGNALQQKSACIPPKLLEGSGLELETIIRLNAEISALRDALARHNAEPTDRQK